MRYICMLCITVVMQVNSHFYIYTQLEHGNGSLQTALTDLCVRMISSQTDAKENHPFFK